MLSVEELKKVDEGLEFVQLRSNGITLGGITDKSQFLKDHILFIRDKKFLKSVLDILPLHLELGLIVDKDLYQNDFPEELKGNFLFEATSSHIPLSICALSEVFYEAKFGSNNEQVDGRQMGTADIHPTALISQGVFVGEKVRIGENVRIHSGSVIGSYSEIGDNCEIFPNVVIYHNVKIGQGCRIHAGTVIGSDGYGYNFDKGVHHKIYHAGGVVVEDQVEIGAGTCIDCGTFSPTVIGRGSKLDNLVHIAHNVKIGQGVLLCAGVAIAGSSQVGDYCVFAGMSGMADNCTLGRESQVGGGAKVTGNWPDKSILGGHPARPLKEWLRGVAKLRKLTETK